MKILTEIFFSVKEERRTRGHGIALAKKQCRLNSRKFSFSQRTVNKRNRLSTDCVGACSVNMFKNKIDIYLIKVVGLSISQIGFLVNLLTRVDSLGGNLVKSCKSLLNLVKSMHPLNPILLSHKGPPIGPLLEQKTNSPPPGPPTVTFFWLL